MSDVVRVCALMAFALATARGQRVQLELRPRAGDTLRMRLDQVTEITGTRASGAPIKALVTTLSMFSRAIVESSTATAAVIQALTDSVRVTSTDAGARALAEEAERQLRGRQLRLRLSPDGTVGMAGESPDVPKEVTELVAVMPASFPREPVVVGESWEREMPIMQGTSLGVPVRGMVHARFRLDSLSPNGGLAYVSMRGTFGPRADASPAGAAVGGTVTGHVVVNRRRGWLRESRFLVQTNTTLVGRGAAVMAPMQFRVTITQHMRVSDKR